VTGSRRTLDRRHHHGPGPVDDPHAAAAQLLLDPVARYVLPAQYSLARGTRLWDAEVMRARLPIQPRPGSRISHGREINNNSPSFRQETLPCVTAIIVESLAYGYGLRLP
jgi:hypothetical protein